MEIEELSKSNILIKKKEKKKKTKQKNNLFNGIKHVSSFLLETNNGEVIPISNNNAANSEPFKKNKNIWKSRDENIKKTSAFKLSYMGSNSNR